MNQLPEGYASRLIEGKLSRMLGAFGAVSIEGPKGCGKTWLGLKSCKTAFMIGDYDEYGQPNRQLVEFNLRIAMEGNAPHLIDEWQDVPALWDAVRSEVDRRGKKGQFLLTGSSVPKKKKPVHTGTGRIKHLRMRTMSLYELGKSSGAVSLGSMMSGTRLESITAPHTTLDELVGYVVVGGWPENIDVDEDLGAEFVKGYLESIIEDASTLDGSSRKLSKLWSVFKSLSRNECTLASDSRIHRDTGVPLGNDAGLDSKADSVSYDSVQSYIDVFNRLYLIDDVPAFDPNLKSSVRVGKVVKRHLVDPSLAVAALGVGKGRLMKDLKTFGCLFESLCMRDILIYSDVIGANVFHYRDDSNMEVDAIVEMPDGEWGAFEIKLGHNQVDSAIQNLIKFKERMEMHGADSAPSVLCVICGLSDHAYVSKEGVFVIPITCLGP